SPRPTTDGRAGFAIESSLRGGLPRSDTGRSGMDGKRARRVAWWLAGLLALPGVALAADPPVAAPAPPDPDCVGLVLGGGGARGIAHVGVLKVLERERIPVCAIAGTSMGAIVGGLYATGYDAGELERLVGAIDWADVLVDDPARRELPMERKDEDFRHLIDVEIGYRDGRLGVPAALVPGQMLMLPLRQVTLPAWPASECDALTIPRR